MELKAKSADKEKASLVMHLRRQVALSQKDLAERQEAMAELEKEHHNVLKTMKAQASRAALNGTKLAPCSGQSVCTSIKLHASRNAIVLTNIDICRFSGCSW